MAIGTDLEPHDWQVVCDLPATADAAWNDPVNQSGASGRGQNHLLRINPLISSIRYTLYYDSGDSAVTDPVIVAYGQFSDSRWIRLANSAGDIEHTVTVDLVNDVLDSSASIKRTEHVELRTKGASTVLALIKTAYAATGTPANARLHALPMIKYQIL